MASPCGRVCASSLVRPLDRTYRWPHACPGTPALSTQLAGDTGSGGRSAAGQLGVIVVSTRAHESVR
eukprot:6302930-Prymnesium_polylepis.1